MEKGKDYWEHFLDKNYFALICYVPGRGYDWSIRLRGGPPGFHPPLAHNGDLYEGTHEAALAAARARLIEIRGRPLEAPEE